jgi:hypothetical protein
MGVRVTDEEHVALYDSVTDTAFGPIFDNTNDADDFLDWLKKKHENSQKFAYFGEAVEYHQDARVYGESILVHVVQTWREERRET